MYSLTVRDHVMVARSLTGAVFGPAQQLHGATLVVDVELRSAALDADGIIVDINQAQAVLREVLAPLNYRNLDDVADLQGRNATIEFLCAEIFRRLAARLRDGALGEGGRKLAGLKITLHESHLAWASFDAPLGAPERARSQ
jgi:6-pyruvoyl-tetrahydropterin synthase